MAIKKKRILVILSGVTAVAIAITISIAIMVAPGAAFLFKTGNIAATTTTMTDEQDGSGPTLRDDTLSLDEVTSGLRFPTSMAFLDADNMLVLQKNDGQVRLVSDGKLAERPVLQVNVDYKQEQGLLGIAVWNGSSSSSNEVFLYLTENATNGNGKIGAAVNSIYKYRYDWEQKALVNGTLILRLPGTPGPYHNGGKITIGPDGYLYAVIGDVTDSISPLGNEAAGKLLDNRSVIVRINRETGEAPSDNPFYGIKGLEKVYAYGIRNSFGMDFDPITKVLWMTEDGPDKYDEINVVEPGFNSGWDRLAGPMAKSNVTTGDLVMLKGAHYSDPVFSWYICVGVTDIKFFDSEKLGDKYKDNVFVGDINNGNLYFFNVDQDRTGFYFSSNNQPGLEDRVADPIIDKATGRLDGELSSIVLGKNFGGRITDIETGPDGYLYVLTYLDGKIYRISPGGNATG
ncbi:MAG TPA: PQQ-dependent sugar dehydrogenase [Nitrososphaera sp.]|nr:PQQ-dependent sugar dehydrogenase [Nitrososphaera sp.]